ncbi:MAG: hypothetical protein QOJ76_699 [Acidobacteriota bacterium]|nr:hypothetical protein [Acidobacteriota bacterium]
MEDVWKDCASLDTALFIASLDMFFRNAITPGKENRGHAPLEDVAAPPVLFRRMLDPTLLLPKPPDFASDQLAFERRGAVDKDDAVAVVSLVEHAARSEF